MNSELGRSLRAGGLDLDPSRILGQDRMGLKSRLKFLPIWRKALA